MPTQNLPVSCSWSGGKDSCYALMHAIAQGAIPKALLNIMHELHNVSRSHGLPIALLRQQADALSLPVIAVRASWEEYQPVFIQALQEIKASYQVVAVVFGDIDLQQHRDWEEMVCEKAGLAAILPLWQQDRKKLLLGMLDAGIETMIVSCNLTMGESFLGRYLSLAMIPELEALDVDVCGELGEFHTLVVDCPLFSKKLILPRYTTVLRGDYWFIDWV